MKVTGRVLVLVMCLFAVGSLFGKEKSAPQSSKVSKLKRPQINTVPREIAVEERGIGEIYTWPGYETQINLPSEVEIKQFGVGDGDLARWVVSCGQTPVADTGAKNVCHAKSGHPGQFTNLNVMTTDGTYSFELAPATSDHPIDLKVFVTRAQRTLIASNGTGGFAGGAACTAPEASRARKTFRRGDGAAAARQPDRACGAESIG